jgi:serum/glucocorticoid-regulated kinase 2
MSQFARRHGVTDITNAYSEKAPAMPDEEVAPPPVAAVAQKEEPKGMFSWMFGSSKRGNAEDNKDDSRTLRVDDFDLLKIVGKGAFGKVLLVRKKAGFNAKKVYAMKVLKKSDVISKGQVEHTNAEQAILCEVRHPFIVCLRFSFQTEDKLYLVTDYYSGGNLFAHLRQAKFFTEERAKFYAAELLLALDHLHKMDIIYRDLKLENILMDHLGHICLTDFGLSKQDISTGGASTFCGTAEYLAPELIRGANPSGVEVDWWSFGILLYEMMNGRTPFFDKNRKAMYIRIVTKPPTFDYKVFSPDSIECISGLLVVDPKERLGSAKNIMKTAFFSTINFDDLYDRKLEPPFKPQGDGLTGMEYVPKQYQKIDPTRDSSARTDPGAAANVKMAKQMATAFGAFSFSEESLVKEQQGVPVKRQP